MPEADATSGVLSTPADENDGPYVGLRPFRIGQRHLIFGRGRDAQLLRQKIYSSRLTLLYAPSGVGKTSLLSALVIPSLENPPDGEEGAIVVSFEHWQATAPLEALVQRIAEAGGEGASAPGDPLARTLIAIQRKHDRSVVLVLDQFEQMLIGHPDQLDALGRELGQAVQLADGCHIVISLREEFLASLHPLRQHIPALMSSTYRLEHLAGADARAAITEPAAHFSASVDRTLVDALVEDLRADTRAAAGVLTVPPAGAVELPFLQLVCRTLWTHSDRRRLTLDLYRGTLGGRSGIIQRYLDAVFSGLTATEQDEAARILHRLAPQSGVKKLYLPDELAGETGLPVGSVSRVLDHFSRHSVLRTRDTGGAIGYELHHDAFTAVLRPWIDARLATAARRALVRRRAKIGAAAVVAAGLAALFIWPIVQARARVSASVKRATESFAQGQESVSQGEWANLAGYLTARNQSVTLLRLLSEHRRFVPRRAAANGMTEVFPEALAQERALSMPDALSDDLSEAGVTVVFGPERPIDAVGLHYAWRVGASRLMATSGLPVPVKIRVAHDQSLAIDRMIVRREGREGLVLPVPSRPDHVVLIEEELRTNSAREALEALRRANPGDVEAIQSDGAQIQGWYVPYWTAPLWNALGIRSWPEESAITLAINARLRADPGVLLDSETVAFLLNRTRTSFCETVAEAESARGGIEGIREDLIAVLKKGGSIGDLPDVLDALAMFPSVQDSEAVAAVVTSAATAGDLARAPLPPARHIARAQGCASDEVKVRVPERFKDLLFPPVETEVHVALGAELARSFDAAVTRNQRTFQQVVTEIRKTIYQRSGIDPPDVSIPRADRDLASRQFSILLPGRAHQRRVGLAPAEAPEGSLTEAVTPLLMQEMNAAIASFIKADGVSVALNELPSDVNAWLRQTYSLTDLKILLRDVIGRDDDKTRAPERTLAQLPWLLGSLTFWTSACPTRDERCLVDGLLSTQRARIAAPKSGSAPKIVPGAISAGILELRNGAMKKAVERFNAAVRENRGAAADAFSVQWVQLTRAIQGYQLTRVTSPGNAVLCSAQQIDPDDNRSVSLRLAWEIEDYLDVRQPGVAEEEDHLELGLCLLRTNLANQDRTGSEAAWQRLMRDPGNLDGWPAGVQLVAGRALLDAVRFGILDEKHLADSQRLVAAAFVRSSEDIRSEQFSTFTDTCQNSWRTPRCLTYLGDVEAAVPDSFWLPFQLGVALSVENMSRAQAETALRLLDKAESKLPKVSKTEQARIRAWMLFGRGNVYLDLARDRPEHVATSRDLYRKLLAAVPAKRQDGWPAREDAYWQLLLLEVFEGHTDSAQQVLDAWSKGSPDTSRLRLARAFLMLERGDEEGLKAFTRFIAIDESADLDSRFMASVGAILTNTADASNEGMVRRYLTSDHVDRDSVRMLLYWRLESGGQHDAARALLDSRWSRLDPEGWSARLDRGEIEVWPEMLLGYFQGSRRREQVFEGLDNEAQYRDTPMGRTYRPYATTLSKAHFYDGLLQSVQGDEQTRRTRMKRALERVVEVRDVRSWEYYFARYLLRTTG